MSSEYLKKTVWEVSLRIVFDEIFPAHLVCFLDFFYHIVIQIWTQSWFLGEMSKIVLDPKQASKCTEKSRKVAKNPR